MGDDNATSTNLKLFLNSNGLKEKCGKLIEKFPIQDIPILIIKENMSVYHHQP